ncbi:cytochrome c biogenesis protein CcdA [Blastococcus sp. CT_GayMR19]|uniref:cytochrome c biogenesis CcdA family protein n=1 Tax=Blastococcus sp. CT_GayMR19 TaxID=2559608 RepID=UPI0010748984|nr:cytochrome c biogenesis protein CcdA [Blastococcus sp. CT_GayMR19]TFV79393.1 cytochrome c biogenesis protein CcdA [Blastococcus sp. CT_GayMR19]
MQDLLLSTTVFASFIGGVLALLAPCCASVMLPAYFASSFRRRSRLLLMTVVFAAGVGTVILPIALGASAVSRLLNEQHTIVFSIGGGLMILAGLAMLSGWQLALPMPSMRTRGGGGTGSVYSLGAFSGAASACCAPVLAGVAAVSGAVASFPAALAVGVAYVFGMVAPLAAIALLWDRQNWGRSRLLASRMVHLRIGRARRTVLLSTLLSSGLMVLMGALTIVFALLGQSMSPDGWQVRLTAALGHWAALAQDGLAFIPGWLSTLLIFGALTAIAVRAARSSRPPATTRSAPASDNHSPVPHFDPISTDQEKIR